MLNLKLVPAKSVEVATVESKLRRMKILHTQIKELQAEYTMLQDEVIIEHFSSCVEFRTDKGLLLATYKESISNNFQSADFKIVYPDLYESFKKECSKFTFLLK